MLFANVIFEAPWRELTGGCEYVLLESGDFGQGLEVCRVWVQSGLWFLYGGRAKTGRTGVLVHQVCKVCTKSAKSASCTLDAHFFYQLVETNAYFIRTIQSLGEDFKHADWVQTSCTP